MGRTQLGRATSTQHQQQPPHASPAFQRVSLAAQGEGMGGGWKELRDTSGHCPARGRGSDLTKADGERGLRASRAWLGPNRCFTVPTVPTSRLLLGLDWAQHQPADSPSKCLVPSEQSAASPHLASLPQEAELTWAHPQGVTVCPPTWAARTEYTLLTRHEPAQWGLAPPT